MCVWHQSIIPDDDKRNTGRCITSKPYRFIFCKYSALRLQRSMAGTLSNRIDYFQYYTSMVSQLLSQDEDLLSLSSDQDISSSSGLPASKNDSLKLILRKSVVALTREVDELLKIVLALHRIEVLRTQKQSSFGGTCEEVSRKHPRKKSKLSSSSSSISDSLHADPISSSPTSEVSEDLQIIMEHEGSKVEEIMKKYSDEQSATLCHMEQKLEELLDIIMSSFRPMTLVEKHKLRRMIEKLPPKNLERVAEIIHRGRQSGTDSCEDVHINLELEDNVTLWRLHFYVEAVENARERLAVEYAV